MGCKTSKHDDIPAVAVCRHRCNFLAEALHQSNALSESHVAYMNSLKSLGTSLHHFFSQNAAVSSDPPLKIPPHNCGVSADHRVSTSSSSATSDGSHIKFVTDAEGEEREHNNAESLLSNNEFTLSSSYRYNYFPNNNNNIYHNAPSFDRELSEFAAAKVTPPPPPPAPSSSTWDFLNFFDAYDKYELPYTVAFTRNEQKVEVKEKNMVRESKKGTERRDFVKEKQPEDSAEKNLKKSNNIADKNEQSQSSTNEILREIEVLFEIASESGVEVLKSLDPGKLRNYLQSYSVSSKISSGCVYDLGLDEDLLLMNARNLSITLKKLCMWEKKLFNEVKAEEKLRKLHARKCRQIQIFEQKGADAQKLDSLQTLVMTLSTKIKIAIHVIDKLSITINKLRDRELWPQINELINRLLVMWKAMLDCHRSQSRKVVESKNLDFILASQKLDDAHLEAAIQLKMELQSWNVSFCNWVDAQKGYVKALNGWLLKCLLYEPEATADGIAPFSPGRIGAPSVFVICHQWSQAMDQVSENDVTKSMQGFLSAVDQLLERHNVELQQKAAVDKSMERRLKILERREQNMLKLMQNRERRIAQSNGGQNNILFVGGKLHQISITNTSSLHSGLTQIFSSMEMLASNFTQAYEELQARVEEDSHSGKK